MACWTATLSDAWRRWAPRWRADCCCWAQWGPSPIDFCLAQSFCYWVPDRLDGTGRARWLPVRFRHRGRMGRIWLRVAELCSRLADGCRDASLIRRWIVTRWSLNLGYWSRRFFHWLLQRLLLRVRAAAAPRRGPDGPWPNPSMRLLFHGPSSAT